jgi:Rod binding domain-containing protein
VLFLFSLSLQAQDKQVQTQHEKIQELGAQWESIFLQQMYQQMKATHEGWNQEPNSLFKKSNAEKIFESMRDQKIFEKMGRQNPIGISDLVVRQLEGKSGVPSAALLQ